MQPAACLAAIIAACLTPSLAHAGQLNDTGQVTCYDDSTTPTGTVSSGTPAPESSGFEGQDCSRGAAAADAVGRQVKLGNASVKGRDYSKLDSTGAVLADSVTTLGRNPGEWACTRDNVTGLVWMLRLDDGSVADRDHRYSFGSNSNTEGDTCEGQFGSGSVCNTDPIVQVANLFSLCGGQDWGLPTPAQLESLFVYENPGDPANLIDRTYFPDQVSDGATPLLFWSQTASDAEATPSIWVADFNFGWMLPQPADLPVYLRLVRQPSTPAASPRFSASTLGPQGHRVIVDAETGLMWKECPEKELGDMSEPNQIDSCAMPLLSMSWSAALGRARDSTFAGFDDWRLPNINELASIRTYGVAGPTDVSLDGLFIDTAFSDRYWSSTNDPRASSLETAMAYQFSGATAHVSSLKASGGAVRLVRGGNFLSTHAPGGGDTSGGLDFSFANKNAAPGSTIESDATSALAGFTGPASLRVSGAAGSEYRIGNDGLWSALPGAVNPGDTIRVRHLASNTLGGSAVTTLNIGGVSRAFTSTAVASPPGAPTDVVAVRGNASASLSFVAPASNGGSAITAYTATSIPAGGVSNCASPPSTSCTVSGLSNGVPYVFTVTAVNAVGPGTPSDDSNQIIPATVPGAPTGVVATAGVGSASVSFTPPADTGGSAITGYTVLRNPGSVSTACGGPPCSISPLSFGVDYTFSVRAINALGSGPASAQSNVLRLAAAPTIRFESDPRTSYPLNHNGGFFILFKKPDLTLVLEDADTAPDQLSIEVTSSNPTLLPATPDETLAGVHVFSGAPAEPLKRTVSLRPAFDLAGDATLTFTVRDPDGLTATTQVAVSIVAGNRLPTATFSVSTVRLPENAQAGTYEVPGFVVTSSPGAGEEFAQTVSIQSEARGPAFSQPVTTANVSIDAFTGTLRFTILEPDQEMNLTVWPTDTGPGDLSRCTPPLGARYGVGRLYSLFQTLQTPPSPMPPDLVAPCGEVNTVRVVPHNTTLASVTVVRTARRSPAAKAAAANEVTYEFRVRNDGSLPITGAILTVPAIAQLSNVSWTCTATTAACSPVSGQGAVRITVDLDLDEEATVTLTGTLADTSSYVAMAPYLELPGASNATVFANGVERIDVVSNDFLFRGGFEGQSF